MAVLCGHPDQPHFAKNRCKKCYQAQPHVKAQAVVNATSYRRRHGQRVRRREHLQALSRKFGLTPHAYTAQADAQGGACAICRQPNKVKRSPHLCVDHCHATGKLRALLCHRCNAGLGLFGDDTALLQRAIDYLTTWREQHGVA